MSNAHAMTIPFTMKCHIPIKALLRMSNIDRFNDCTARLFAMLYQEFPFKVNLNYAQWLGDEHGGEITMDDLEFCKATVHWLQEAGYITTGQQSRYLITGVGLTAKGLEVLKAVPESVDAKQSIGESLIEYGKGESVRTATSLISTALTEGFKIMVRLHG